MQHRRVILTLVLTFFFCLPVYLLSRPTGGDVELRRTGGSFPEESSCATSDCHGGMPNTGPGQVLTPPFFVKNFLDAGGKNPIAALHGGGPEEVGDPNEVSGATPVDRGEFISLFATGFGPTDPPFNAGEVPQIEAPPGAADLTNPVSVTIGGLPVPDQDVLYAGVAPCCAGLYQLVVKVPDNAPDGNLAVVATVGGVSTPDGPYVTVMQSS